MNLKTPNIYHKYQKKYDEIIPKNQLRIFSALQGLITIDKKWCNKNLCHMCPLKMNNYVDSK